jgi:membrane protease YdiL (CAAX protease family)
VPRDVARFAIIAIVVLALDYAFLWIAAVVTSSMPDDLRRPLGSIPFYALWICAASLYAAICRERADTPWRFRVTSLSRRDRIIVATWAGVGIAMYLQAIVELVTVGATVPRLDFIGGALMAPIVEELIFRGLMWNEISHAARSERHALITNLVMGSLIFGFYHLPFDGHSWRGIGFAFIHAAFGFVMGVLRWRSRSVLPGTIVHLVGNFLAKLAMP